jgi:hypothetical protein
MTDTPHSPAPRPPRRAPDWGENAERAPISPASSSDRAPAVEDCRDLADQGPACWVWMERTRTWGLMGRWAVWNTPHTLWVPWWAIDLPGGWGDVQP